MTRLRLFTLLIILPLMLHALPKEILADKYLVGAKASIDKQDYQTANDYFQKIIDLDIVVPDDFYFQYAKNSLTLKDYDQALKNVNLYLEKAGSSGKYYRDALLMSIQAEEGIKEKELKKQQWDRYRAQQEEKRRIEAAIPRYSLTIVPKPSNAKIQIKYIKDKKPDEIPIQLLNTVRTTVNSHF